MQIPDYNGMLFLIVEDDEPSYICIEEMLVETNAKLLWATNGNDAISSCEKYSESIDVILMDVRMPEMDGLKAVKIIKKRWPSIPVVAHTAFSSTEDKENIYSSGFNYYITKPINSEELYKVLNKFILIN